VNLGLPKDVSVHGWRIDRLLASTTVFVTIMFVVTIIWILWACLRHGRKHRADYDLGSARKQIVKALALSTVIFLVVDGNLWVNGMADLNEVFWNFDKVQAAPNAVRIQVNAHQWAWDARYAGPDGKFNTKDDVVTLNDLRVPVGRPIVIQLASTDVVHSFALPNLRIKQDAVPGQVNRLWFEAKETGVFELACMQHCGTHHYKMRGTLTILPGPEYEAWASQASEISARNYDPEDKGAHWGWDWERGNK
jgi:cytochrome c oxidase subunit 2